MDGPTRFDRALIGVGGTALAIAYFPPLIIWWYVLRGAWIDPYAVSLTLGAYSSMLMCFAVVAIGSWLLLRDFRKVGIVFIAASVVCMFLYVLGRFLIKVTPDG